MSRLLADGHVPRMENNAVIVSDSRGREVLRASSDEGLFLLAPPQPVGQSVIACPVRPVPPRPRTVRPIPWRFDPGQPVQLPVALARTAGVRVPVHAAAGALAEFVQTRVVQSAP